MWSKSVPKVNSITEDVGEDRSEEVARGRTLLLRSVKDSLLPACQCMWR